ncbi:MAG: class I SAM-dependent methyltransferase [Verrucomicrobia bacterium]|nr:class I SAM-dependent methyltransferase [Verrucomicrobiota bacterium]
MTTLPSDFPLRLTTAETHARIHSALRDAGFDEATLCRELKIQNLSHLGRVKWKEVNFATLPAQLQRSAGLFLFGEQMPRADLEQVFGAEVIAALLETGLLRPMKSAPDTLVSPVFFYPVGGFLIASDRHDDPDGQPGFLRDAQPDVVFPGIFGGTLRFLELLPPTAGDALDLCGGSGIGALCLARQARLAVTADLTPRATRFAEFNLCFNGCARAEAVCGDLYAPVAGRQFDVITAHPPYVPALGGTMIYRDAGDAGEDITRNVIAGLPTHLRPGGLALVLCQGRDAEEGVWEQRARAWLGEANGEFDVVFALQDTKAPEQEVSELGRRKSAPSREELAELLARFRKLGTKQFVYGALAIHRHRAGETIPWTVRVRLSPEALGPDFAWLIAWHHRREERGFSEWLAQSRPRLSPHFELNVRHVVQEGTLVPAEFVFEADRPFKSAMRIDGWVAPLAARFNGQRTPAEIHAEAKSGGEMPADFELRHFTDLLGLLVENGFLALPQNPVAGP